VSSRPPADPERAPGAHGAPASDPKDRTATRVRAGRIGAALNVLALAVLAWAWAVPLAGRANVACALLLPVLALWLRVQWRGLFRLTPALPSHDARRALFPALALPAIALAIDIVPVGNLLDWDPLVVPALVCGLLVALLALRLCARTRGWKDGALVAAFALVPACLYAGEAIFAANAWLDSTRVQPVRVSVTGVRGSPDRHVDGARLLLGPAPTAHDWTELRVVRADFDFLRVGDVACLGEHAGLFGLAWAEVHRCPGTPDRAPDAAARHWLAHVARPPSQRAPITQAVIDGDWRTVDATLGALQRRFEAGEASDVDVERAYIPLYNVDPALDAPLADWLAQAPNSYAARLAMALHTERQVEWLTAGGFGENASPGLNWQERTRFELAQLEASMALSTRPTLSLMARYRLTHAARQQTPEWLARLAAAAPDDLLMRREFLLRHPLCPCEGATPDDPALRQLLQAPTSPRVRDALAARRLLERGLAAGRTQRAIDLYRQGLALHPHPQDAFEMHINIAEIQIQWNQPDEAATELHAAIATLPGNRHAHEDLGYVYEMQKRMPEALAEFLIDAQRRQSWAQMRTGSFLLTPEPGVSLDRKTGAYWMREAANAGEARARDILRRHPDLMIEYPPTY
jgi:tetratricopeptide (TPR) repeat protein